MLLGVSFTLVSIDLQDYMNTFGKYLRELNLNSSGVTLMHLLHWTIDEPNRGHQATLLSTLTEWGNRTGEMRKSHRATHLNSAVSGVFTLHTGLVQGNVM